jgi:glycosyltransferase involved in cell wall biosynthesis
MQISVIIPVYNAEKYVAKAVESALQFPEVKEVFLIEDGSPDNALQVCQQLAAEHDRVILLQHPDKGNHGAGASRNLGLENASFPYIAFLDADDFYLPNRFDEDKQVFAENPDADGVYNGIGAHFYSEEAETNFRKTDLGEITTVTDKVSSLTLFESFIWLQPGCGYFSLDGLTIRKKTLDYFNYWFNPDLRLHQDSEFIIRLTYYANLLPGEINKPTAKRGVHSQNRITSLQTQNNKIKQNQKKLWTSLYHWANDNNIPESYHKQIRRIMMVKTIISKSYIAAWFSFLKYLAEDFQILSKPSFYNTLHYHFFGKNRISVFLLRVKNRIFKCCVK